MMGSKNTRNFIIASCQWLIKCFRTLHYHTTNETTYLFDLIYKR
jgi:hypothetical protein